MGVTRAQQEAFAERFADIAVAISQQTGVKPEVVLGQTALETGWGTSVAGGNMFGIKGPGQMVTTKENIPGRGTVTVRDSFRAYDNPVQSFNDYAQVTIRGKSLSDIVSPDMTVEQQAKAIKASGYATDPNYARSLAATARAVRDLPGFQDAVVSAATATIPTADTYFEDVIRPDVPIDPVPAGYVEDLGPLADLTPAREAGFSWDIPDLDLEGLSFDIPADPMSMDTFNDVFDAGFQPTQQAAISPMDQSTFDSVFDQGFPADPLAGFSPVDAAAVDFSDVAQEQPSGFHAGFEAGPYGATPDFNAKSLEQRNAEAFNQDAIRDLRSDIGSLEQSLAANEQANFGWNEKVTSSPTLGSFDTTLAGIRDQEAEFGVTPEANMFDQAFNAKPDLGTLSSVPSMASMPGPSFADLDTPQAPIAPSPVSAAAAVSPSSTMPQGDFDEFAGMTTAPTTAPAAVSRPSAPVSAPSVSLPSAPAPQTRTSPTQEEISKQFDLPSFDMPDLGLPDLSLRGIGSALGLTEKVDPGFMDAMSNIDAANAYQPGFFDTRLGKGLVGAATGFATGGPFGAVTNGLWGGLGIGDMLSREFDRYSNAYANLSPADFAAFGLDGDWTTREPTMNTGMTGGYDGRGGGRVGDGSYSEHSGRNDNNPQGIL